MIKIMSDMKERGPKGNAKLGVSGYAPLSSLQHRLSMSVPCLFQGRLRNT